MTEIGLTDIEHVHHRLRGHADLLADHAFGTGGSRTRQPPFDHPHLDAIGILDRHVGVCIRQRRDGRARFKGIEQRIAERRNRIGGKRSHRHSLTHTLRSSV